MFHSTVECYDCHQQVRNLAQHRSECTGKIKNGKKSRHSHKTGQVECYTCHEMVTSLDAHRKECQGKKKVLPGIDVFVALDVSDSMRLDGRLDKAKEAIRDLHQDKLKEYDRLSIITFDTQAVFKLKPRPNGELLRKKQIDPLLKEIVAKGATALYDAIWMAIDQIQDKNRPTRILVLTDGEDNSSKHTLAEVRAFAKLYTTVTLDIVYIHDSDDGFNVPATHLQLAADYHGSVQVVKTIKIIETVELLFQ